MTDSPSCLRIDILSLFPGYFKGPFDESIIARARKAKLIDLHLTDIRKFADNKHNRVDARPYGGGPGMVLMPGPVVDAVKSVETPESRVIYLSPQGKPFNAETARRLAEEKHLIFLAGHYEGIDERALEMTVDEEISIGDYVLTNGCLAAIVVIDALIRFIPEVLGHGEAANEDSFEKGLLDYPHYTRPEEFRGMKVPEVLLNGNHKNISAWRDEQALKKTKSARPDLYERFIKGKDTRKANGQESL